MRKDLICARYFCFVETLQVHERTRSSISELLIDCQLSRLWS
nr:MAG TPA: hypothetical protein [Caudoviricetes sp.]